MNLSKILFPIRTIACLNRFFNNILNAPSKIPEGKKELLFNWFVDHLIRGKEMWKVVRELTKSKEWCSILSNFKSISAFGSISFSLLLRGPSEESAETPKSTEQNTFAQEKWKQWKKSTSKPGFDVIVRLVTAAASRREQKDNSQIFEQRLSNSVRQISTVFLAQKHSRKELMRDYIYRNFHEIGMYSSTIFSTGQIRQVLSSDELATAVSFSQCAIQQNAKSKMANL